MKQTIKEHEEKYIHLPRRGIKGILYLPVILIMSIILFPFAFIIGYIQWFFMDDSIKKRHSKYENFEYFLYGSHNSVYELNLIHTSTRK